MKMRRMLKENKGYSLVEMIIVIAIIVVLSAAAMTTIGLINSAKAKEAGVTLDSEISSLIARAKSQEVKLTGATSLEKPKDYVHAIAIYEYKDSYYIAKGFYKPGSKGFYTFDTDNGKNGTGKEISKRVSISYEVGNKNDGHTNAAIKLDSGITYNASNAYVIAYDNMGRCIAGVGKYDLKKDKNTTINQITVNANGSHIMD